jgi:Ca2+-binding RTX toxin-like protein
VAILTEASTTDTTAATGGNDVIVGGGGTADNIVLAGVGDDRVNQAPLALGDPLPVLSTGVDIVIGDNGYVNWDGAGLMTQFASTELSLGGNDLIAVGDGNNIVVGGFGSDTITTGADADIVLGDNGEVSYAPDTTLLLQASTTDIVNGTGGGDTIDTGEGDNLVMAGVGADTVTTGNGVDLVMGDNGQFNWGSSGLLESFTSTSPLVVGVDAGSQAAPDFADIDGDGDLDVVVGGTDGTLHYFENTGTAAAPNYVEVLGTANPFNGIDVGTESTPVLADIDGDGDLDLVVGATDGTLAYFENTGTTAVPIYVEVAGVASPLDAIDVGSQSTPVFADIDGDGDLDLVVGTTDGTLSYFQNTGTAAAPVFVELIGAANPYDGIDVGSQSAPNFVDADNDGDLDLVVGTADGTLSYFENTGTAAAPTYVEQTGAANPFDGIDAGDQGKPTFADLDGDGDVHVMVGAAGGTVSYFADAGGDDVIVAGDGANIVVGGYGNDTITTGFGTDIVLGDNGVVTYTPGTTLLLQATSTDAANGTGGNDTINVGQGDNLVLAGVGGDTVTTGDGVDLVMGDNGQFNWDSAGLLTGFASSDPTLGGDDQISVGNGDNIVVGGFGADTITTGANLDIVLGDNGLVSYTPGTTLLLQAASTDTTNATGGNDTILAGEGDNLILAGVGADAVTTGGGVDLVMGDNGQIDWASNGEYSAFQTTDPLLGANDVILAGDGDNIVAGGFGADQITVGLGQDLILGDNGIFSFTPDAGGAAVLTEARTTDLVNGTGGDDTIVAGDGINVVLAGVGADTVSAGTGADIVIGDNGYVNWDTAALITQFGSSEPELGGNDAINVGDGANIVVGGFGADTILTGADADIVLGDDGQVDYVGTDLNSADIDLIQSTSTTAFGGADTITTLGGDDIVIGGRAGDTIDAGEGNNLVIGDSGQITADVVDAPQLAGQPITLGLIETIQLDDGGADLLTTGTGNDIVLGGFGGDTLTAGAGNDTLFGDNGQIVYVAAVMNTLQSTDTVDQTGGNDVIDAGEGNNLLIAGVGNDTVTAGAGADVVVGDNGMIITDAAGAVVEVISTDPLLGGNDVIATGDGFDVAIGAAGADSLTSAGGNDILFGDGGQVVFSAGGTVMTITSVDVDIGGNDTLDGAAGNDILIGGFGNDLLFGSLDEDLLFGSYATVILTGGFVTSIAADLNDLLTAAMLAQFDGSTRSIIEAIANLVEGLPGYASMLESPFDAQLQPDSLLDVDVFRKVFRIDLSMLAAGRLDPSMFQEVFDFDSVTQSDEPAHGWVLDSDDAGNAAGSDDGAPAAEEDARPLAFAPTEPPDQEARGGDMLIAAFGLAGLNAVQQSQSRRSRARAGHAMLGTGLLARGRNAPDLTAPI